MNLDADCSLGAFFDLPSSVGDVSLKNYAALVEKQVCLLARNFFVRSFCGTAGESCCKSHPPLGQVLVAFDRSKEPVPNLDPPPVEVKLRASYGECGS